MVKPLLVLTIVFLFLLVKFFESGGHQNNLAMILLAMILVLALIIYAVVQVLRTFIDDKKKYPIRQYRDNEITDYFKRLD